MKPETSLKHQNTTVSVLLTLISIIADQQPSTALTLPGAQTPQDSKTEAGQSLTVLPAVYHLSFDEVAQLLSSYLLGHCYSCFSFHTPCLWWISTKSKKDWVCAHELCGFTRERASEIVNFCQRKQFPGVDVCCVLTICEDSSHNLCLSFSLFAFLVVGCLARPFSTFSYLIERWVCFSLPTATTYLPKPSMLGQTSC